MRYVEGAVTRLVEEDGVVTGVTWRDKESGKSRVRYIRNKTVVYLLSYVTVEPVTKIWSLKKGGLW